MVIVELGNVQDTESERVCIKPLNFMVIVKKNIVVELGNLQDMESHQAYIKPDINGIGYSYLLALLGALNLTNVHLSLSQSVS